MPDAIVLFFLLFQTVVIIYFVLANGTYTFFTLLSLLDIRKYASLVSEHNINTHLKGEFYRPLSIIVPAHNEEATITASVTTLLSMHYPEYEVIVVNDGSTDATMEKLTEAFRLVKIEKVIRLVLKHKEVREVYISLDHPNLFVLCKEQGGKSDALNAGINASAYPLFCSIDADSLLEPEALLRASRLFVEDRRIIATGGIVRVLNGSRIEHGAVTDILAPNRLIEGFQSVEYIRGFLSGRTALNHFGSLLIISGAFGIFRKDMVLEIQGYRDTVGEDMDLVVRLHKHCREQKIPYRIEFIPDPICFTEAPADLRSLLVQRNRWQRGLIDSLLYSRHMFLNPRYGAAGIFGFAYFTVLEALSPVVEFLGYAGFIVLSIFGYVNSDFAVLFFAVAVLWGIWLNISAILLDDILYKRYKRVKDLLKLCMYGFLEMLGFRQLLTMERMLATLSYGQKDWGRLKRQKIDLDESPGAA